MIFKRLAIVCVLAVTGFVSGCAVYPYPAYPVAYGDPNVVYAQTAPVVVAPAPVYYGPAYPAIYPSISIHGRFGSGGHRHGHRHH